MQNFYMYVLGVALGLAYWAGIWIGVYLCVHMSGLLGRHMDGGTSASMLICPSCRSLSLPVANIVDVFLLVHLYYIMSQLTITITTKTLPMTCVLWSIPHHLDDYTCSQLCGPDNIRSARCGSGTTVYSEGHSEGCCWPPVCATATRTSV